MPNIEQLVSSVALVDEVSANEFSPRERSAIANMHVSKHFLHLAGVLALRRAVSQKYPNAATIEIVRQHMAPPCVLVDGHEMPTLRASISHTEGVGIAAVTSDASAIGVDIELSNKFKVSPEQFYSKNELTCTQKRDPALMWVYKEAFLKALRQGITIDPRRVSIELDDNDYLSRVRVDNVQFAASGKRLLTVPGFVSAVVILT